MTTSISDRRKTLNTTVLLLVVFLAVYINGFFPEIEKKGILQLITVITSKGLYELLIATIFGAINKFDFALRWYWGDLYIKGLWSYEYSIGDIEYYGVWDIRQNVEGVSLIGCGLDHKFRTRTMVRSVSPLIEEAGGHFFINSRNELQNDNAQVFSKTTLLLDRSKNWREGVISMRGITVVYGGPSDKQLHPNVVFKRHADVNSIEELIEKLKSMRGVLISGKPAEQSCEVPASIPLRIPAS